MLTKEEAKKIEAVFEEFRSAQQMFDGAQRFGTGEQMFYMEVKLEQAKKEFSKTLEELTMK